MAGCDIILHLHWFDSHQGAFHLESTAGTMTELHKLKKSKYNCLMDSLETRWTLQ